MSQLIGLSVGAPYVGIIIVVIIVDIAVTMRLCIIRSGSMRAKCPKCATVFDASQQFHIGPLKQLKCPSCGKTKLMNAYAKDPVTWRPEEKMQQ